MNIDSLHPYLQSWQRRRQLRRALLWLPRGLLAGLMVAAVVAAAARLRPFLTNSELLWVIAGAGLTGLVGALGWLLAQRPSLLQQARFADRTFGLQERVSTAVELHTGQLAASPEIARRQWDDTLRVVTAVNPQTALPLRLNRQDWLLLALTLALLTAAVLIPNPQENPLLKQRAITREIEEQITALEALQTEIINNPDLTDAQQEQLLEPVQDALAQLESGDIGQEGAVAALSEAEADLRQLGEAADQSGLRDALQSAGEPLAENSAASTLGQALQNGNLFESAAAAAQLADDLGDLSAEEQAQLAEDLAETAAALESIDSELAQELADAADALQNGNVAAAQQALQEASGTLQQRAQQNAASQQAQAAAGQLAEGRQDVAEAGQTGAGQPSDSGQQAQGQTGQQGQSGQSGQSGQGQGQGGEGSGEGSGQGQGQGQGSGSETGEGTGGPGPGGGHAENVFVPDFVDLSSEAGIDIELPAECIANPALCGGLLSETPTEFSEQGSTVPYTQVFGDYRDAAYESLNDDYIPLGLKGYIRDYFSSLEP